MMTLLFIRNESYGSKLRFSHVFQMYVELFGIGLKPQVRLTEASINTNIRYANVLQMWPHYLDERSQATILYIIE